MLDVAFTINAADQQPIYRQLASHIQELIDNQRLTPGVKLPPTRLLADSLGLNRNTINHAYQDLLSEGYLTARVGQGTFVANRQDVIAAPTAAGEPVERRPVDWSGLLSTRTRSFLFPARAVVHSPVRYDFRGGNVALDHLPLRELRRGVLNAIDYRLRDIANQRDPFGWHPLRERVVEYLVNRGLQCSVDEVAIVNGAQQALDLVARTLINPGDTVVIEQPGYFGAASAFQAAEANIVGVGIDREGLRVDALASILRRQRVKLIYTTPAAQSPTGVVMSEGRRADLLALAKEHNVPIFEDDYDSELRYGGPPVPALKSQDTSGRVIYAGTFGKVLMPGLRIGYVVADRPLLFQMILARWTTDMETNQLMQVAMADILENGGFERHIRRLRRVYAERLAAMVHALERFMPQGTTWITPGGGHGVWLTWPEGLDAEAVYQGALQAGVAYTPGDVYHLDDALTQHAALTFAAHTPDEIADGIRRLGEVAHRADSRKGHRV